MASKYEELECLYAAVGKVIYEGLTNYEKATSNTNPTQLFGKIFSRSPFFFLSLSTPLCPVTLTLLLINPLFFEYIFHTPTIFPTKVKLPQSLLAIKPVSGSLKCKPMGPAARANIWSV